MPAQSRSGSRSIPSVESSASASATRRPAMTRSGAISASGTSTKARSNSARMRQRQFRLVEPDIVIGDQIEVEGARTPACLVRAVAAEFLLDLVQREQQRVRIEAGFDLDAGIDEGGLLLRRPRAGWRSPTSAPAARPASCRRYWRWPSGMSRGRRRHCRRARSARQPCQGDCRVRVSTTPTSSKIAAIGACGLCTVTLTALTRGNAARMASATAPAARSSSL